MTTLKTMIATFLDDLTLAQDRANELSVKLSKKYRHRPYLRYFPVPNALLDEADLTLHFSVDAVEKDEEGPREAGSAGDTSPVPRIAAAEIAAGIATLVLADLRRRIALDDPSDARAVAVRRQLWMPAVRRELTRNLLSFLHSALLQYGLGPHQAGRDVDVRAPLADALVATFGEDEDLIACVGPARDWSQQMSEGDIGRHANTAFLDVLAANGSDVLEPPASVHIQFAAHPGDSPQHLVQTVRLRARLRNYKWVIVEEGDHELYQLVAES